MTQFNKNTKTSGGKKTHVFNEYGYVADGNPTPDEYLVRITSIRNMVSVVGLLQEDITMRVESRWDSFIPTTMLAKGNMLLQLVSEMKGTAGGPKSLVTKAASRRLWVGSTPMTLSLKLKFEAINDSFKDVVEPCRILQSLALPSEPGRRDVTPAEVSSAYDQKGITGVIGLLPTLTPPGPSPFSWEGILTSRKPIDELNITSIIEGSKGGDRIMLQLGKFLRFDDVIVREVSTTYHARMDMFGDPISADIAVVFETYEIPTVQSLEKAYEKTALFGVSHNNSADKTLRREFHITTFG
jgi:hypothetical protein